MAIRQKIIWTVLPNGVAGDQLKLSLFVSPRLETDEGLPRPQLAQFPDFADWPTKVKGMQFALQFQGVGSPVPATYAGPDLEPDLWAALFKPATFVRPYKFLDYRDRNIRSHPVAHVHDFLKTQYQAIASQSPTQLPNRSLLMKQLAPIMFTEPAQPIPRGAITPSQSAERRVTPSSVAAGQRRTATTPIQAPQLVIPERMQSFIRTLQPRLQPKAEREFQFLIRQPETTVKPSTIDAFQSIMQELQQNRTVRPSPTAQPTRDFMQVSLFHRSREFQPPPLEVPQIDFHEMLSALGGYPELMRRLGLVIDLQIPSRGVPASSTVQVAVHWPDASPPSSFHSDFAPLTTYAFDSARKRFVAAPKDSTSNIANGLLNLSDEKVHPVVQVDVDSAAIKTLNLADQVVHAETVATSRAGAMQPMMLRKSLSTDEAAAPATPTEAQQAAPSQAMGLPALRNSGISVARTGRAEWLVQAVSVAAKNNQALEANQPNQVIWHAEDLVRGYRIDVWDSQSKSWHSLCKRKGTHTFLDANLTREYEDEGFVQVAVVKSGEADVPDSEKDLYLHESIFSWDGWSLCAPHPGKSISPGGQPERADDPSVLADRAKTEFRMTSRFLAIPGSLPRLRFGVTYRVRARVVDLAGNSLKLEDLDPNDFSTATAPHFYSRFDPVVAPLLCVTKPLEGAKNPGESLYNAVIRSNFDKATAEYASIFASLASNPQSTAFNQRLIAPPKTSPLMAERHAMFDNPSNGMKKDQATYDMIAKKSDGAYAVDAFSKSPLSDQLVVPYLPDPLSRGAALIYLDRLGKVVGTLPLVQFYGRSADWPDPVPFLLRIVEGKDKPEWEWNEGNRTLTVRLPKAEVGTLRISSVLGDTQSAAQNEDLLGVWNWVRQSNPSNLRELRSWAVEGRHWMLTPFRDIGVVHAVQQPLISPEFHKVIPVRGLGQTFSLLRDDQAMPIDGKSTIKLDIMGDWQEPIDDVSRPEPKTMSGTAHVFEKKIIPDDTKIVGEPQLLFVGASSVERANAMAVASQYITGAAAATTAAQATAATQKEATVAPLQAEKRKVDKKRAKEVLGEQRPMAPEKVPPLQQQPETYGWKHEFGDTKYRKVRYHAVATTRFREYFPAGTPEHPVALTRESTPIDIDVPNSARPKAPKVLYVIPTFGWDRKHDVRFEKDTGTQIGPITIPKLKGVGTISTRAGGWLRVYLDRPWYSSGDGELLGAVVWPSPAALEAPPATPQPQKGKRTKTEKQQQSFYGISSMQAGAHMNLGSFTLEVPKELKPLITQWGIDPIWSSAALSDLPTLDQFKSVTQKGIGLTLDELKGRPEPSPGFYHVAVAGYKPEYDKDRRLWYCDIQMDPGQSYFPFVRLALVRYQPISVEGAHLSRVVLADFAQLGPDRTATMVFDTKNLKRFDVIVTGVTYSGSATPKYVNNIEVTVETNPQGGDADFGWVPAPDGVVPLKRQSEGPITVWREEVRLDKMRLPKFQAIRLIIREYEIYPGDSPTVAVGAMATMPSQTVPVRRLIYADVLKVPTVLGMFS